MPMTQDEKHIIYTALCLHIDYIKKEGIFAENSGGGLFDSRRARKVSKLTDEQIQVLSRMIEVRDKVLQAKTKPNPKGTSVLPSLGVDDDLPF